MRSQKAETPAPAVEAGHGRREIEMLGGSRVSNTANLVNKQDIAPHVSKEAIAAATAEYHATRHKIPPRNIKPRTPMEREALVGEIFEAAYDVNRASLAAMVAIGAEDFGLAREQLGMLVADVKLLARLWDRLEQGGAA